MELEQLLLTYEQLGKEIKGQLRVYTTDENIPLDKRWKVLIENPHLFETYWRTDFGLDRDDEFLYEGPCYMEKYETRTVQDILESMTEDEDFAMTEEEIITFKEYCLEKGISKMKFDW